MASRLGAAILALGAGAAGIVVAALLLRSQPGPVGGGRTPAPSPPVATTPAVAGGRIPTPDAPGFPSPPPGAVVFAREAGTRALGLAVVPGGVSDLVRVTVLSGNGPGVTGLAVSLATGGARVDLAACGSGCYQASVPAGRLHARVVVRLGASAYALALPPALRLPPATAIVARASSVWRHLKTLVWHERLAATPTDALTTVYEAVAPDELAYTITGHSSSIIIGRTRWDKATPSARWMRSVQDPPIQQPLPFWAGVSDAHILGSGRVGGRSVWRVSFFDPTTPAWFEAQIEKSTGRTLRLDMVAVAHFMHHVYGPFDAPIRLRPPAA